MNNPVQVQLHFKVIEDSEGFFTAVCEEFPGLVTCEKSLQRLMNPMMKDAIVCWFDGLKKLGQLEKAFAKLSIAPGTQMIHFATSFKVVESLETEPGDVLYEPMRAAS